MPRHRGLVHLPKYHEYGSRDGDMTGKFDVSVQRRWSDL